MKRSSKFETPTYLAIEENARIFLSNKYKNYGFFPLAEGSWVVDWAVYSNGFLCGFAEFRRRFVSRDQYPDFRFSAAKWAKLVSLQETFNVPSVFYLQYNDALCVIKGLDNGLPAKFVPFGRNRMRDAMDAEPSVIIPIEKIEVVHFGCVSDTLTDRPAGRSSDAEANAIQSFGVNFRREMGFTE